MEIKTSKDHVLALMQPTYLPWMGFFDLIYRSDIFVIYDTAQFSNQSWHQRNRIRNREGELLLTLPVKKSGNAGQSIKDVELSHAAITKKKHLHSIKLNYAKAKNFSMVFSRLKEIYQKDHEKLIDLNMDLIRLGIELFQIKTPVHFTSSLNVKEKNVEAILEICSHFNASTYYSPAGARDYIGEGESFSQNGIKLIYQNFTPPAYPQLSYPDFIPSLSFIDYVFNNDQQAFFDYPREFR